MDIHRLILLYCAQLITEFPNQQDRQIYL